MTWNVSSLGFRMEAVIKEAVENIGNTSVTNTLRKLSVGSKNQRKAPKI